MPKKTTSSKLTFNRKNIPPTILIVGTIIAVILITAFLYFKKSQSLIFTTKTNIDSVPAISEIQNEIDILTQANTDWEPMLGSYPPRFLDENERAEVEANFITVTTGSENFLAEHNQTFPEKELYQFYYLLGNAFRMGHNLDLEESWEKSEFYLKRAIAIYPQKYDARAMLARLYVNTGPKHASNAEALFLDLLKEDLNDVEKASTLQGLFFAYYYQGKTDQAQQALEQAIELFPTNENLLQLRKATQPKFFNQDGTEK